jgi:lipoprotein-releasing system ATP-binding protein
MGKVIETKGTAVDSEIVLEASNIAKTYKSGAGELSILSRVSLQLRRGELVAITGASGVGKSTLLHILGTLDQPSEGQLRIMQTDVLNLPDDDLADFRNRHIGFVFQFHNLLPEFTAVENAMLPAMISGQPITAIKDKATALLTRVGLEARLHHRPGELSGGECQRVAVVRALVMQPLIVLADEPSGNLDTETSARLHDMIIELAQSENQTFLIMTHDRELASRFDRSGTIEDGQLQLN